MSLEDEIPYVLSGAVYIPYLPIPSYKNQRTDPLSHPHMPLLETHCFY